MTLSLLVVVSSVANCPFSSIMQFMQSLCTSGMSSAFSCWCMDFRDADRLVPSSATASLVVLVSILVDLWRFVVTFFVLFISSIFFSLEICSNKKIQKKTNCDYFVFRLAYCS